MKVVVQRCCQAHVEVEGVVVGRIGQGLAVFLGVAAGDDEACARWMAHKVAALRIFDNEAGKFNFSLRDVGGEALVISNFTLCGNARKGTRPSFGTAASPDEANRLYELFATLLREQDIPVETGVFAAAMQVMVANDGPVTLTLEVEPASP